MRSRQIAERLGVEEAHMLEFQQFNMIWDRKMAEYETHAEELVEAMKERHGAELRCCSAASQSVVSLYLCMSGCGYNIYIYIYICC